MLDLLNFDCIMSFQLLRDILNVTNTEYVKGECQVGPQTVGGRAKDDRSSVDCKWIEVQLVEIESDYLDMVLVVMKHGHLSMT